MYGGVALIGLAVAAYYGIASGLKNCQWLDRLLGISGCVASHRVNGLRPSGWGQVLVVPAGGASIFFAGEEKATDTASRVVVLVILDAVTGAERRRIVVAKTTRGIATVGSDDGRQVALVCDVYLPCFEDGSTAIMVSPSDGTRLDGFRRQRDPANMWRFPTDPDHPPWAGRNGAAIPGSDLVVGQFSSLNRSGTLEIRKLADSSLVRPLRTGSGDFVSRQPSAIAVSPSGRSVAVLSRIPPANERFISVFDIASGKQVASLAVRDPALPTMAWAGKEDRLVLVRPVDSSDMRFDVYSVRPLK
jgi:hypothetical protein